MTLTQHHPAAGKLAALGYSKLSLITETESFLVYRAQTHDDQPVIIKTAIKPTATALSQLEHELEIAHQLNPEFVLMPLKILNGVDQAAMILGHTPYPSLTELLRAPMKVETFLRVATGITKALAELHSQGLIHKDIMPANIFVDVDGNTRLTGFGVSSLLLRERQAPNPPQTLDGTLAYMAPEQTGRMNRSIDFRSDLYALGVVFYQMLTGQLPFTASDPMEWVHSHIARQPKSPRERLATIPEPLSELVMKLLAKNAEQRYQSTAGLMADLEHCVTEWRGHESIAPFSLGMHDISDRLLIPEKLYGRQREIELLAAAFDRVKHSGQPEFVLISGQPGIGKSALVDELRKVIASPNALFAGGKFDQFKRDAPYASLAQILQTLVRQILGKSEKEIIEWRLIVKTALGPNGRLVTDLVPDLIVLIGEQPRVQEVPPQDAQNRFNMVFRRLLGVLASPEQPLILFLDDLQWLDTATLQLLEHLFTHPDIRHILLLGAYRDNEVDPTHPLPLALASMKHAGAAIHSIVLGPLEEKELLRLTSDCFHCDDERAEPLAHLLFEKTAGNPFFTLQFLTELADEELVTFDNKKLRWQWDLQRIRGKGYTDNVADLMVTKLKRLKAETREALKQLACLGSKAKQATLALIQEVKEEEIENHLLPAIQAGFLFRQGSDISFLHDRVQEAAYAMIPKNERPKVHLNIGRKLLAQFAPKESADTLFDILNHLNQGRGLMTEAEEKIRLAELNATAGRRARNSIAYMSARDFFSIAAELMPKDAWNSHYDFMFPLHHDWAETEYLHGAFADAENLSNMLFARAKGDFDKAAVYRLRLSVYPIAGKYDEAVTMGRRALQVFGEILPEDDESLAQAIGVEAAEVENMLQETNIADIAKAPEISDPRIIAKSSILTAMGGPAYIGSTPQLFPLLAYKVINATLKYGVTKESSHACSGYAHTLIAFYNDPQAAYAFSEVALSIGERFGDLGTIASALYLHGNHINFWLKPIASDFPILERGFRTSLDAGNLIYAGYIAYSIVWQAIERGDTLDDALDFSHSYAEFALGSQNEAIYQSIILEQQFMKCLLDETDGETSFSDETILEHSCIEKIGAASFTCGIAYYHIMKTLAAYLMGDNTAALEHAAEAKKILPAVAAQPMEVIYYFIHALVLARACRESSEENRDDILQTLMEHRSKLKLWAEWCPENFACKYALVAAEVAEFENDEHAAEQLFEEAVKTARTSGFSHWEAMANEAAARFYGKRRLETASRAYIREARACYTQWGAVAKTRQLDTIYPWLAEEASTEQTTISPRQDQLDLLAITKAQHAISGEIVQDKLAETLLHIVMEHAGAQNGYLSVEPNLELFAVTDSDGLIAFQHTPSRNFPGIAESILNYVKRTGRSIILADASTDAGDFANDKHLQEVRPKSILCLPILRQATLLGIVYLENNLTTNAFTQEHRSVLEVLASQAAISLQNAQTYKALQESELKYRRMIDTAREGILTLDEHGRITFINAHMVEMLGYSSDELIDPRVEDFMLKEDLADHQQKLANRQRHVSETYERRLVKKDGSILWVLISATPIFEGKHYRGALSMISDITARKEREDELKRYRDHLEETVQQRTEELRLARDAAEAANKAKSVFLANMSHELRTPLNAILGFSQMMQQDSHLNTNQHETLDIINNSGAHLLKLINDVLEIAKIEAGKLQLDIATFDLHALVHEVSDMMRLRAEQKGLKLELDQSSEIPRYIRGDEARLRQILVNLVSNAVKFTEAGRVAVRLKLKNNAHQHLLLEIEDNGPGISKADQQRLFQPFVQLPKGKQQVGTGLGLAIVRQFVQLMNGTIAIESTPGKGSLFRVELSLNEAEETDIDRLSGEQHGEVTGLAPGQPVYRILIAEDQHDNQLLLAKLMTDIGMEVKTADNGEECVEIFKKWKPDLIWMDRRMPIIDGEEATRRIRELPGGDKVKIVAVTASAFTEQQQEIIAAGMDDFVRKPYRLSDIYECIAQQLGVELLYSESAQEKALTPANLTPEMLAGLADELRTALHEALDTLDSERIGKIINRIGEDDHTLAQTLRNLAENYDYPAILNALDRT